MALFGETSFPNFLHLRESNCLTFEINKERTSKHYYFIDEMKVADCDVDIVVNTNLANIAM